MSQMNSCFAQFFYRVNSDRTWEAICGFCFVASHPAANQAELRKWEKTHVCPDRKQSLASQDIDLLKDLATFGYGEPRQRNVRRPGEDARRFPPGG